MIIDFDIDGTAKIIYTEKIELDEIGSLDIKRASHVEPNEKGEWVADMSPVGGPMLGPFKKREVALREEVKWLEQNVFNERGE